MTLYEAFNDCIEKRWLWLNEDQRIKWKHRFNTGEISERKMKEILMSNGYGLKKGEIWDRNEE